MKKKILIVAQSYYPINSPRSIRTTELVREFARQGNEVTIITTLIRGFDYQIENDLGVIMIPLEISESRKTPDKLNELKILFSIKRSFGKILFFFFHYPNIKWMLKTIKALENRKNYDILITIAVPHPIHWGAYYVNRKKHQTAKVWIADCGDPFMGLKMGMFRRPFYFRFLEKKWCSKTDYITVPFEGAKKGYYREFYDKIKVIPQGLSFPELKTKKKKNRVPTFIYSGSMDPYKHYYIPFFEYLRKTNINFKFIIFTKNENLINKHSHGIKESIILKKYVDRRVLIGFLKQADFLIHFPYKNGTQKSLKLIDYHFSETPILSYKGSEDDKIIDFFLNGNYSKKMTEESIDQFKIENICTQFLSLS